MPTIPPPNERRAILRIDPQPTGTKFQGVWLQLVDGTKWLIDSQPRVIWTWFRDREVVVTGSCFEPAPDAITATHFRVDHMRAARRDLGVAPYLSIGPEQVLGGEVVEAPAPPESKATTQRVFRSDDGTTYGLVDGEIAASEGHHRVLGRIVEADMTYAAHLGGLDLWIAGVDQEITPVREIPCP